MLATLVLTVDKNGQVDKVGRVLNRLDNIALVDMADIEPEM